MMASQELDSALIRSTMETILPDVRVRKLVLDLFADSIELANKGNSRSWSLATIPKGGLRLQVAYLKMAEVGRDGYVYLLVDASDLSPRAEEIVRVHRHPSAPALTDTPNTTRLLIAPDQFADALVGIREAYEKLILRVRNEATRYHQYHAPEAVQFLMDETARDLPTSPYNRSSAPSELVRRAMYSAYPDAEVRRLILNTLVDSIESANQGVPGSWSITFLNRKNIRLTVGPNSTFFLGEQEGAEPAPVSFSIASGALSRDDAELAEQLKNYTFHRPDGAISITIPVDRWHDLLPRFLPAHHALIEQTRSGKASGGAHMSREVTEFIETETVRKLPKLSVSIPNAWKISTGDKAASVKESTEGSMAALGLMSHKDASLLPQSSRDDYLRAIPSNDLAPNHGPLQIWSFITDVQVGDRVYLSENGAIRAAGVIVGEYYYERGKPNPHRRAVEWEQQGYAPLTGFTKDLSKKLSTTYMTLESLTIDQANEIDARLRKEPWPSVLPWQHTYARIFPDAGLHYTPWQQAVFFTALQTKGFVILSGISGTGKTKIAQAFAAALPQPEEGRTVEFLTVRPDWRDSKSLIGYHNPITDRYERTPFLTFLLRAVESWERRDGLAWFVILDEMNLAHVEHYFAELLSILESGRDSDGWTNEAIQLPVSTGESELPARIKLPPNLFLIGTVNLDETTHAFSPKVLDRAFAMEFSDVTFDHYSPTATQGAAGLADRDRHALLNALSRDGDYSRIDRAAIMALLAADERPRRWLETLNRQLRPHHMHFGFRVFDEIMAFVDLGLKNGLFAELRPGSDSLETAFDAAVLMKVLPKFHGSRSRLEGPLTKVLAWCFNPDEPDLGVIKSCLTQHPTPDEIESALHALEYRFPETAKRASRLLWTTYVDGFAAFG
jgi:hypothetical protein